MKRFLKYFGLVVVVVGGLMYISSNHSISDETQIVCKGSFYSDGKALGEKKIYFKFQKYRWWVHLWSDSDGEGFVEDKDGSLDNFSYLKILRGWGDIVFDRSYGQKNEVVPENRTVI
jgi:hypothetical protein